jgi:hypothetical protein
MSPTDKLVRKYDDSGGSTMRTYPWVIIFIEPWGVNVRYPFGQHPCLLFVTKTLKNKPNLEQHMRLVHQPECFIFAR